MISKEIRTYKRRLQTKEQELISSIAKIEVDGRESVEPETQDLADKADGSYIKESLFQQSDSDRAILGLVKAALARVERSEFGKCAECGRLVEKKRLDAVPWAR